MRRSPRRLALVLLTGMGVFDTAGAQQPEFYYTLGGPGIDVGNSVVALDDGGYAVLGYSDGDTGMQRDAWLLRIDPQGDTLWTRRYGGATEEHGRDLTLAPDGSFVMVGFRESPAGDQDVWVARASAGGDLMWDRTFGGPEDDRAWCVRLLDDGDLLVVGETRSFGHGAEDVYLLRSESMPTI